MTSSKDQCATIFLPANREVLPIMGKIGELCGNPEDVDIIMRKMGYDA